MTTEPLSSSPIPPESVCPRGTLYVPQDEMSASIAIAWIEERLRRPSAGTRPLALNHSAGQIAPGIWSVTVEPETFDAMRLLDNIAYGAVWITTGLGRGPEVVWWMPEQPGVSVEQTNSASYAPVLAG